MLTVDVSDVHVGCWVLLYDMLTFNVSELTSNVSNVDIRCIDHLSSDQDMQRSTLAWYGNFPPNLALKNTSMETVTHLSCPCPSSEKKGAQAQYWYFTVQNAGMPAGPDLTQHTHTHPPWLGPSLGYYQARNQHSLGGTRPGILSGKIQHSLAGTRPLIVMLPPQVLGTPLPADFSPIPRVGALFVIWNS